MLEGRLGAPLGDQEVYAEPGDLVFKGRGQWHTFLGADMAAAARARTPEELETLLEDAVVLHDHHALAQLFQEGAMLVVGGGLPEARGHQQITKATTQLWDLDRRYLAEPRRILQARDTALVLAGHATNVVHRADDGCRRHAISLLDPPSRRRSIG